MSRLYANSVIFKFISEKNTEWIGNQYGVTLDRKLTSGQVGYEMETNSGPDF